MKSASINIFGISCPALARRVASSVIRYQTRPEPAERVSTSAQYGATRAVLCNGNGCAVKSGKLLVNDKIPLLLTCRRNSIKLTISYLIIQCSRWLHHVSVIMSYNFHAHARINGKYDN